MSGLPCPTCPPAATRALTSLLCARGARGIGTAGCLGPAARAGKYRRSHTNPAHRPSTVNPRPARPNPNPHSSQLVFNRGGHQGGEGCDDAAEFWVQGALEELDAVNEYFYDAAAGKLYFMPNTTDQNADGSPRVDLAEVPAIANFFSLFGAEEAPVTNVSFQGITFTGGRPTMFDPHGQPSGGDWALERMGAILLEGTEDVIVADCLFERIDSNAVFLSGYNRRAQVVRNEFSLLGNNAVASWGRSVDWDGTGGQQPRHSLIMGNIVHDIGLEQKQSSFYFQAQSCENTLAANIVYNIPRAAVNAST